MNETLQTIGYVAIGIILGCMITLITWLII